MRWLTPLEAAEIKGCGTRRIQQLADEGAIGTLLVGRQLRVDPASVGKEPVDPAADLYLPELAQRWAVSLNTVRGLVKASRIRTRLVGRTLLVSRKDVRTYEIDNFAGPDGEAVLERMVS